MKYYRAYSALCLSMQEQMCGKEQEEMGKMRDSLFALYKKYDPDNSFDLSKDYDWEVVNGRRRFDNGGL